MLHEIIKHHNNPIQKNEVIINNTNVTQQQLYMVVCKDNYNNEIADERIVATNLVYQSEAIAMVTGLNASQPKDGPNYYVVEPASYIPFKFQP